MGSGRLIDEIGSSHTIVTADFNGDGRDKIVTGDRGDTRRLYLYAAADANGGAWSRRVLDDDMSPSGCAAADLNGDGRVDLICISGRSMATPAPMSTPVWSRRAR